MANNSIIQLSNKKSRPPRAVLHPALSPRKTWAESVSHPVQPCSGFLVFLGHGLLKCENILWRYYYSDHQRVYGGGGSFSPRIRKVAWSIYIKSTLQLHHACSRRINSAYVINGCHLVAATLLAIYQRIVLPKCSCSTVSLCSVYVV